MSDVEDTWIAEQQAEREMIAMAASPDNTHPNYYTGMSRDKLIDEHKAMLANLTAVQKRCSDLIQEARLAKKASSMDAFQKQAERTSAPKATITPEAVTEHVLMAAMGCAGEGGEVVDLVKKFRFHGKPFDAERLIEEIGDVLWYVADMASALGVSLSDVAAYNVKKLDARYPDGFEVRQRALNLCTACGVHPPAKGSAYGQCVACDEEPF